MLESTIRRAMNVLAVPAIGAAGYGTFRGLDNPEKAAGTAALAITGTAVGLATVRYKTFHTIPGALTGGPLSMGLAYGPGLGAAAWGASEVLK